MPLFRSLESEDPLGAAEADGEEVGDGLEVDSCPQ
jgi:hypothetical protein